MTMFTGGYVKLVKKTGGPDQITIMIHQPDTQALDGGDRQTGRGISLENFLTCTSKKRKARQYQKAKMSPSYKTIQVGKNLKREMGQAIQKPGVLSGKIMT